MPYEINLMIKNNGALGFLFPFPGKYVAKQKLKKYILIKKDVRITEGKICCIMEQ